MANTAIYGEEWTVVLQERLDHPTNWKEVLDVHMTNIKILNNPFLATTPAIQTGVGRGSAYTFQDFVETNEALTIGTYEVLPIFVDQADLSQSTFSRQMYWADLQGQIINERLENRFLAQHASWTDFGTSDIGGGGSSTTQITVSATNIDDIIRGGKRVVNTANGIDLMARNGVAFIWRPADFETLEAFIQANGFNTADMALKNCAVSGVHYMGVDHYISNEHTANHVWFGVKKVGTLGILRDTFGQVKITQDPGLKSGVGIISRVDFGFKWWNNYDALYYDVNVV